MLDPRSRQTRSNRTGVPPTGFIVIAHDNNPSTLEGPRVLRQPLRLVRTACTARVRRRYIPGALERMNVFLTLAHHNDPTGRSGRKDIR